MSLDYTVCIESLSKMDGGSYLATVPELPGCMSDGGTPEEALRNIRDAIVSWIDSAKQWKQEIPTPRRLRVHDRTDAGPSSAIIFIKRAVEALGKMPEGMREPTLVYLVEQAEKYRILKEEIDKGIADIEAGRVHEWNYGDFLKRAKLPKRDD